MKPGFFRSQTDKTGNSIRRATINLLTVFVLLYISALISPGCIGWLNIQWRSEGKGTAYSIKTDTKAFNMIKGFVDWGSYPTSELVRGTDGNLYGMILNRRWWLSKRKSDPG